MWPTLEPWTWHHMILILTAKVSVWVFQFTSLNKRFPFSHPTVEGNLEEAHNFLMLTVLFYVSFVYHSVLVGEDDLLKISDFGTCKEFSEKSAKMTFAGTVAWMAPEVIRNEPCSEKVDVW